MSSLNNVDDSGNKEKSKMENIKKIGINKRQKYRELSFASYFKLFSF